MKKSTTDTQALADAASEFIAQNTQAPRLDGKPHRKASVKKGKRSKKAARKASPKKARKVSTKTAADKPRQRAASNPKLPAVGEKLIRVYKGKTYEVEVLKDGFQFKGKTYPSLTATAMAITGYKAISGPVFFRLVETKRPAAKKES